MVNQLNHAQTSLSPKAQRADTLYATSWYVAMRSDLLKGKPQPLQLFGEPLVAWRDCQGKPVIMARYCAHLGASLAQGKVMANNCLRCPFHHWQYDATGQCVEVPNLETIPRTARQKTYPTIDRYGYIWVWYGTPTPLFPIPEFPEAEAGNEYSFFRYDYSVTTTGLRAIENLFDIFHFLTLHELHVRATVNYGELDKHQEPEESLPIPKSAWYGVFAQFPLGTSHLKSWQRPFAWFYPKSLGFRLDSWAAGCRMSAYNDGAERFKTLWCLTPVSAHETTVQTLGMIRKTGNFLRDFLEYWLFVWQSQRAIGQDIPILNALKDDGGGSYVSNDRQLLKFREFYRSWLGRTEL